MFSSDGMTLLIPIAECISNPEPSRECEIFVHKIPRSVCEQELRSMFEKYGDIFNLRLVHRNDKLYNYAFVRFKNEEAVKIAVLRWNGYEIRRKQRIFVCKSIDNKMLVLFNVPKYLTSFKIKEYISLYTAGLQDVKAPMPRDSKSVNSGLAFLIYDTHACASIAKKVLNSRKNMDKYKKPLYAEWYTPGLSWDDSEFFDEHETGNPVGFYPFVATGAELNVWTAYGYHDPYSYFPETLAVRKYSEHYSEYGSGY